MRPSGNRQGLDSVGPVAVLKTFHGCRTCIVEQSGVDVYQYAVTSIRNADSMLPVLVKHSVAVTRTSLKPIKKN